MTKAPHPDDRVSLPDAGPFMNQISEGAPDAGGLSSWVSALNSGMSRAQVVPAFSKSAEHIEKTRAGVEAGLWLKDYQAAIVARMYDTVLDRQGDAGGIINWTNTLKSGMSIKTMVDSFTGSAEFQMKYGALDDRGFVQQLYRDVLDREGESPGVDAWTGGLRGYMSHADVVLGFSKCQEHQIKLVGITNNGIQFI
jgi:hypothetical protein